MKQMPSTPVTVPHVRLSVRGTKQMGEARSKVFRYQRKALFPAEQSKAKAKAFENIIPGPGTPGRAPGFPVLRHHDTNARAAFFTESHMKIESATKLERKSGRLGTPAEPLQRLTKRSPRFLRKPGLDWATFFRRPCGTESVDGEVND